MYQRVFVKEIEANIISIYYHMLDPQVNGRLPVDHMTMKYCTSFEKETIRMHETHEPWRPAGRFQG